MPTNEELDGRTQDISRLCDIFDQIEEIPAPQFATDEGKQRWRMFRLGITRLSVDVLGPMKGQDTKCTSENS